MQAHQQCDEIALGVLSAEEIANLLNVRFNPNEFPGELAGLIRQQDRRAAALHSEPARVPGGAAAISPLPTRTGAGAAFG